MSEVGRYMFLYLLSCMGGPSQPAQSNNWFVADYHPDVGREVTAVAWIDDEEWPTPQVAWDIRQLGNAVLYVLTQPGHEAEFSCDQFDLDGDGDVDLLDVADWQSEESTWK